MLSLTGIHHVTAISADIRRNYDFYTRVLGMRLVKRTVNQDDTSAYHLFYADGVGTPGSDLTFFDWPVPPERRGTHSIIRAMLRVHGRASLEWWAERLRAANIVVGEVNERDGRLALDFEDPEGQRLTLIDDGGAGEFVPWQYSPVPAEHQIRGLGPVMLSVARPGPTDAVLRMALGMQLQRSYVHPDYPGDTVYVYTMGEGGPAAEVHVIGQPQLPPAQPGAGGVHHVAFRVPTFAEHEAWARRLRELRIPNSGIVDRYYFRSIYFREPNGILFELATDEPGFAVDEPFDALGERLALPPFLEPYRAEIEAGLKPL
ncbi:ring-cleaving dioxygenase [Chloroflexus sp.]|uniref:ring-cleaving dioxygenase n=1 Tax=Chloroflexus sp. TaxID=1904827 RepID=UPI0026072DD0|nr:ring-cleaving dioxygenase [uncultured Chloroflexus sp.]